MSAPNAPAAPAELPRVSMAAFMGATWLAVFPLSLGLSYLLEALPHLASGDRWARAAISTSLFVPMMDFVVLPLLRRALPR